MSNWVKVSIVLFTAAEAGIFIAIGFASLGLVMAWGLGALVVWLGSRLVRGRRARAVLAGLLLPLCVLLTFEGGLFFLPAVAALVLAALRHRPEPRAQGTAETIPFAPPARRRRGR